MNNIYQVLETIGEQNKSKLSDKLSTMFLKAMMAGLFIGMGGTVAIKVMTKFLPTDGFKSVIGALMFSIGFIMIITFGAQLFTGNSLMTLSVLNKKHKIQSVLRNWSIVWLGNLLGAVLFAALVYYAKGFNDTDIELVTNLVNKKVGLSFGSAVLLGIGCNMVITLTVMLGSATNDYLAKVVVSVFGVMVFFLSGYEHVIANMYFMAIGLFNGTHSIVDIVLNNLIPVTIGNILGGGIIIPLLLHYTYKK